MSGGQATMTALERAEIQRRIDDAAPGAVIELPAGRVAGGLVIPRALTLRGAGAGKTTIDGLGREAAVAVDAPEASVRLEGLTITGGRAELGGGVSAANGARVEIIACELRGNEAAKGGAVALDDGAVRLERCVLEENRARTGGGLFVGGIGAATAVETTFRENRAARGGGAAFEDGARATLERASFAGNEAEAGGGRSLFLRGAATRAPVVVLRRVDFEAGVARTDAIANDARFPGALRLEETALPE